MTTAPDSQPLPDSGWSDSVTTLTNAIVVPPVQGGFVQAAGILESSGQYCPAGALWRRYRPLTTEPALPVDPPAPLAGNWLWGGVLWSHFGHFLVESTSRLWALDHLDAPLDGIVFIPKRPRVGNAKRGFQTDFLNLMAPGLPVNVVTNPTQVESLVVPGQGFGLGLITAGTQKFRDAIHNRFGRNVIPDGPERLYISRSALGIGKGGLLGEEKLEHLLKEQGYEVFHPEKHDIATQIARYKAAKQVIAADGSALHLFAMVGRAEQSVAMIMRRSSRSNNLLATNVARFCDRDPLVVSALRTEWVRAASAKSNRLSFGELDHTKIAEALAENGFIKDGTIWPHLTDAEREQVFRDKGLNARGTFVESPEYVRRRVRALRIARREA